MLLVAMIGGMLHVSATRELLQIPKDFSALNVASMFGQLCQGVYPKMFLLVMNNLCIYFLISLLS
jgi:hypothetical protein